MAAAVMDTFNATSSLAPPDADTVIHAVVASAPTGILSQAFDSFSSPIGWFGVFLSLFLAAVIYDQSESLPPQPCTQQRAARQKELDWW
jgi:C-22 sterol desaturase